MEPRFIHLQLSIKIYNLRHYTNPAPLYLVLLSIKSPSMHTPEFSSVNVKLQSRITASYEPVKLNPSRPMPSRRKLLKNFFDVCHFYRLQTQFAEVMFSQVSVCPRGWGGCLPLCQGSLLGRHPLPPEMTIETGGTHPTEMHSCSYRFHSFFDLFRFRF